MQRPRKGFLDPERGEYAGSNSPFANIFVEDLPDPGPLPFPQWPLLGALKAFHPRRRAAVRLERPRRCASRPGIAFPGRSIAAAGATTSDAVPIAAPTRS